MVVVAVKKHPEINNTIYLCSVAHPTYFARRHRKIMDLFLTYWATRKWFLTLSRANLRKTFHLPVPHFHIWQIVFWGTE